MVKFILSGEETITIKLKEKRGARGFYRDWLTPHCSFRVQYRLTLGRKGRYPREHVT